MRPIDVRRNCLTENLLPTLAVLFGLLPGAMGWADAKPKLGPEATSLSSTAGHAYFKSHPAPDFWAMMPFYAAQIDESACSVASVQILVNAARANMPLTSDDELATPAKLVEKVKNKAWHQGIPGALAGKGVTLDELGDIAREALEAYGIKVDHIEVVHADDQSASTLAKLHHALVENEKSSGDFILINFNQGFFTGDASAGHISPLAAYDEKNQRALVMDVDRKWYEPYWVSEKTLLAGMATRDTQSAKNRGWVYVHTSLSDNTAAH